MNNLFTGMSLVSQEEIKKANEDSPTPDIVDEVNEDVIDETPITAEPPSYSQPSDDENEGSFSLVTPEEIAASKAASPVSADEGDDPDEVDEPSTSDDAYVALAKQLVVDGVLSEFNEEEFDGTSEGLKKLVDDSLNNRTAKNIEKFKNSFTGPEKVFLNIRDSFSSDAQAIEVAKKITFYDTVTDGDIENDKKIATEIYSEELRLKGYSPEQITEEIQDADDLGKLETKAIRASKQNKSHYHTIVKNSDEEKKQREIEQENAQRSFVDNLKSSIDSREYIVKGLPFNETYKKKLKSSMTEASHTDKDGNQYTALGWKQKNNSVEFDVLTNYYNELGLYNVDASGNFKPDFSKINKIAKSKASTELDKILTQDENAKRASRTSSNKNNSIEQDLKDKLGRAGY